MDGEQVLDQRFVAWLHEGPTTASNWVSRAAIDHARDHPRRARVAVRWGSVVEDLVAGRPAVVSRRLAIALAAATLLLALAGVGYLAWHQNVVVPPVPLPSPSPTTSAATQSPAPTKSTGAHVCPPGVDANRPGAPDQARPSVDAYWEAAVDAESGVLVLASGRNIWTFDLCANTWSKSASTTLDGRAPVYDAGSDLVVMIGSDRVVTYDANRDVATELGPTPVVGQWAVAYDPASDLIYARDLRSARLWTYDVDRDAWHEIAQQGDAPPPSTEPECDQPMAYDGAARRLVLHYDPFWCMKDGEPRTYEFDPGTASWTLEAVETPRLGGFDWVGPRLQMAYDVDNKRSVLYDGIRVVAYQAGPNPAWAPVLDTTHPHTPHLANDAHGRVPVAYDPINARLVFVGGDLLSHLSQAGGVTGDVDGLDLATMTVTELLALDPAQSAAAVVDTLSDPLGDGGEAEIGQVSTVATEHSLTLRIELQGGFGPDTLRREGHPDARIAIYWNADERQSPGAGGWSDTCDPWLATYRTFIGPDGGVEARYYEPVDQQVEIGDGGLVTLTVPLASFDNPHLLGYAVSTGSDWAPDYVGLPGCHWVPLVSGS